MDASLGRSMSYLGGASTVLALGKPRHNLCSRSEHSWRSASDRVPLHPSSVAVTERRGHFAILRSVQTDAPTTNRPPPGGPLRSLPCTSPRKSQTTNLGCPRRKKGGPRAAVNRQKRFFVRFPEAFVTTKNGEDS